ncbi:MAG TPA: hypothetical protein VF384_10515 [Planctomycetota bacterium]
MNATSFGLSSECAALAMLLATSSLPAADLLVQPGNPTAYQTLQAALNAAQPGDRILIGASLLMPSTAIITKSVTIESVTGAVHTISLYGAGGLAQELRIQALTPGLPLTFRRLQIAGYEMSSAPGGIRTVGALQGEIRFDQVEFLRSDGSGWTRYGGGVIADLSATTVWLRDCRFVAADMHSNFGCMDVQGTHGTSCLKVVADTLHLEDCSLRAASAIHLAYACCFGSPPNCAGQFAQSGLGGTALDATTRNTTIVRCQFSDGNGGTVENNPAWLVPVAAGAARPSTFGGQTGVLDQFGVTHEQALPGAVGPQWVGRGPIVAVGPAAPLSIGGPAEPGTFVGVTLNTAPGSFSVFLVGLAWGEIPTAFGMCWVAPFDVWLHGGAGTTQTYAIPAIPQLRGIPIVVQALQVLPTTDRLNPSGVAVR